MKYLEWKETRAKKKGFAQSKLEKRTLVKKRFANRGIAIALTSTMLLGASGCVAKHENENENDTEVKVELDENTPAWKQYADEKITLDWYINYSWFVTRWGGNVVSDAITEETGVSVNFITPVGNEEEKLKSLISSNSLPDLITLGWWDAQVNELVNKGMVYALNELADQYDPYFYNVVDDTVVDWYRAGDGNFYAYPCSSYTPNDVAKHENISSNQTFLVRKDIYKAIGEPDMTTQEGFANAVRKAAEMFPEVNGEPLIPIGAHAFDELGCTSFDKYLMNFLAVPHEKDGEVYDRYTDPEYLSWLKMFNQLGREGYLSPDIFVDTRTQMSEKIAEGRYFCMLYQRTDLADQEKLLYAKDPNSIYIAVDGPRNSKGDAHVLPTNSTNGWTITLISKNCAHPERAIAFLDYLISEEGQKMVSVGVEGVTYDMVDGKVKIKPEVQALLYSNREEYDKLYGADDTYWMLQNNVMQLQWLPKAEEPLLQLEEWTYPYAQYLGQYEVYFQEDSAVGVANAKINKLWSMTLQRLLLAQNDEEFDAIMQEFVKKRDETGFAAVVEDENRQLKNNKEKLGLD